MTCETKHAGTESSDTVTCVPMYAIRDWPTCNDVVFRGTGTLIHFHDRYLIITAAHVIAGTEVIAIAGFEPALVLKQPKDMPKGRNGQLDLDLIDIANCVSSFKKSLFRFINWEELEFDGGGAPLTPLCKVIGYPAHNNSASQERRKLSGTATVVSVREDVKAIVHSQIHEIASNRKLYIGLRYDPRLLENKKREGPKMKAFNGFSGGAIWQYGANNNRWTFAGIVTECQSPNPTRTGERVILGIRARAIDAFLKARFLNRPT